MANFLALIDKKYIINTSIAVFIGGTFAIMFILFLLWLYILITTRLF